MNRVEFMGQLERLLMDLPESDRLDAIAYYNDYFDEAGPENEASVIQKLGSPGKVAGIIKADLNASDDNRGEYTEKGYSDGSQNVNLNTPTRRERGYQEPKQKRRIPLALLIILIIFASPMIVGVGGGLLGGVIGLLCGLLGIGVAVIASGACFTVAGVVCFIVGIFRLAFSLAEGLLTMGVGGLMLALGLVLIVLLAWLICKVLPGLFRGTVNLIQKLLHGSKGRSKG